MNTKSCRRRRSRRSISRRKRGGGGREGEEYVKRIGEKDRSRRRGNGALMLRIMGRKYGGKLTKRDEREEEQKEVEAVEED